MNNPLRAKCIKLLHGRCNRCDYRENPEILKLLTPSSLTRRGKGQVAYWTEVLNEIERQIEDFPFVDFELVCPNCFELERLQKREQPKVEPKKKKVIWVWETDLDPATPIAWCDEVTAKGEDVYYIIRVPLGVGSLYKYKTAQFMGDTVFDLSLEDLQNCKTPKRFEVYENATTNKRNFKRD